MQRRARGGKNAVSATIGWIGLGRMGLPMARRLLAAGHRVVAFDLADAACATFVEAGGNVAASARAAATGAVAVIAMLPDGVAVRSALLDGEVPAVTAMAEGGLVIDMSSSAPTQTRSLGDALARHGLSLVDAPVSGGVAKAIDGTLSIMVGGEEAAVARATLLLKAMGTEIFPTGALGSGHAMKALNNYVSAAGLIAACEAVRIATAFGLDGYDVVDILNASTGRNNSTEKKLKQQVLSGRFASGFRLALMTKDVGIAAELAATLDLDAPMSGAVAAFARSALAVLGPESDHTEIDRHRA